MIDQFVCVRLVKANDLDLSLFQFDYDLTFAVFFMNADRTLYGRYGTRSSVEDAAREISMSGLAAAMSRALEIHKGYPANRASLQDKQAIATKYRTPNDYPSLAGKYNFVLDYEGAVAKSCMHCHQIRDAERQVYRDAGQPIPDPLMFPNPLPDVIGLRLDPAQAATVKQVAPESAAAAAGFRAGDELRTLDGQPILSLADVQWVLHNADATDELQAIVRRDGREQTLRIVLEENWRRQTDISWRVSSWSLRRMVTGGILFEPTTAAQRQAANVGANQLALLVKHVGQHGPHGAAHRAGILKGDILVSFNGQTGNLSTSQLLAYAAQSTKPGDQIQAVFVRNGKRMTMTIPMQE